MGCSIRLSFGKNICLRRIDSDIEKVKKKYNVQQFAFANPMKAHISVKCDLMVLFLMFSDLAKFTQLF